MNGICTSDGFYQTSTHGNCTMFKSPNEDLLLHPNVVITGCIRGINITKLKHTMLPYMDSIFQESKLRNFISHAIIYLDDAKDAITTALFRDWIKIHENAVLIISHKTYSERIQRLSLCRNVLLAEAKRRVDTKGFVISLDMDCTPLQTPNILFNAFSTQKFDVITANNIGAYRDMWALRSKTLMRVEYDCFWDFNKMHRYGNCKKNKIIIDRKATPFTVTSAFNGMALYKSSVLITSSVKQCRYSNESRDPDSNKIHIVSEHVPYHQCIVDKGKQIAILPSLLIFCHKWTTRHNARKFIYNETSLH